MKCNKTDENGCDKKCKFWIRKQKHPNKYVCMTLPQGLYDYDTVLVDIKKNEKLMKMLSGL